MTDAEFEEWLEELYPELHALAARIFRGERSDHTLQTTAVVHEAYLRLRELRGPWTDREHFLRAAAGTIRRILVDHARAHATERRGQGWMRIPLESAHESNGEPLSAPVEDLDQALSRLAAVHARSARIVELRFFLGFTMDRIADELELSVRTVGDDWAFARAFLHRELSADRADS